MICLIFEHSRVSPHSWPPNTPASLPHGAHVSGEEPSDVHIKALASIDELLVGTLKNGCSCRGIGGILSTQHNPAFVLESPQWLEVQVHAHNHLCGQVIVLGRVWQHQAIQYVPNFFWHIMPCKTIARLCGVDPPLLSHDDPNFIGHGFLLLNLRSKNIDGKGHHRDIETRKVEHKLEVG